MKKIERYMNFLYWGIERKVRSFEYGSWSTRYVPTMSLLAYSFFIGLILLYFFDFVEFIVIMSWYYVSRTGLHYIMRDIVKTDLWNQFIALIAIIPSFIVTYIFVLRKKKYKTYYEQFDKLSEDTKSTWTQIVILLFVLGFIVVMFLGRFRAIHIPQ